MIDDERHPPKKNNKILWEIPEKIWSNFPLKCIWSFNWKQGNLNGKILFGKFSS